MSQKQNFALLFMLFFVSSVFYLGQEANASFSSFGDVNLSKSKYLQGDTIEISGVLTSLAPFTSVLLEVTNPQAVVQQISIVTDESGKFYDNSFEIRDDAPLGTWKVRAHTGLYYNTVEFEVVPSSYSTETYYDSQIPRKLIYLDASSLKPDSFPCKNLEHVFTERPTGKLACISNKSLEKTQWKVLNISFENPLALQSNYIKTNISTHFCSGACPNEGIVLNPLSIRQHVNGEYYPKITIVPLEWFNVISSVNIKDFQGLPVSYGNPGAADAPIHSIEIQIDGISKQISFEERDNIAELEKIREKLTEIEDKYYN